MSYSQTSSCIASVRVRTLFENYEVNPKISLFRIAQTNCVQIIATFGVAIGDFAYLLLHFLPQTLKCCFFPPPCGFPHLIPIFRSCLDKATNMTYPPSSFAPIWVMIMWGSPPKNPASSSHVPFNGHTLWLSPIL